MRSAGILPAGADLARPKSVSSARTIRSSYLGFGITTAEIVGPAFPGSGFSRLGPDRLNTSQGLVLIGNSTPTHAELISSQFCGPHRTSAFASGLKGLFSEL